MAKTLEDVRPRGTCLKCGTGRFTQPYYESDFKEGAKVEWLEWPCRYCGYIIRTKTVDAK